MEKKFILTGATIVLIGFSFWLGYLLGAKKPITPENQASANQSDRTIDDDRSKSDLFQISLDRSYLRAVQDAKDAEDSEISAKLWAISGDNVNLIKKTEGESEEVLVTTWTSWDGYDNKVDSAMTLSREIWVTAVPQVQKFCQELNLSPDDLTLRLEQHLGLPANNGKTKFVEMWVKPTDMFRPCPDPEINDTQCNVEFAETVNPEHKQWVENLMSSSYNENGYPWTRLGYTYDWGNINSETGASEFIVKQGAEVTIKSVKTTAEYCTE